MNQRIDPDGRLEKGAGYSQPTYSVANRAIRAFWAVTWLLAARWTPPPLHRWRVLVLKLFQADIAWNAHVYSSAEIWAPWNLVMESRAAIGPLVYCYNPATIRLGRNSIVSRGAQLCTASHDYNDPTFKLFASAIEIEAHAWVATDAFIGPGVTIAKGAVIGARAVVLKSVPAWTVWSGNPAVQVRLRNETIEVQ